MGGKLRVVSVEPAFENEQDAPRLLTGRSARLIEAVGGLVSSTDLGRGAWDVGTRATATSPLVVHRGPIVAEILREIESSESDVLFVGYHRGGPAGVIEGSSTARRLAHEAPCGVLTIPL
jgi:nucleotide-binding universal stress UspA family protein